MADVAVRQSQSTVRIRPRAWLLASLALTGMVVVALTGSFTPAAATNFAVVFGSLLVGAVPLVMLGAFVAAIIGTFVPPSPSSVSADFLRRCRSQRRPWQDSPFRCASAGPSP